MFTPSPGMPPLLTAELGKTFAEGPDYSFDPFASAKSLFTVRETVVTTNVATKRATTKGDSEYKMWQAASKPIQKNDQR
jgi:hypothetical protein